MKSSRTLLRSVLTALIALAAVSGAHAAEGAPAESHNIIQVILSGGPLIVMIWLAILGTSITMVTFIIQLFLVLRDEQLAPAALLESLRSTIAAGNYQEAWEICRANKAYIALVLGGALERVGRGKEAVETALIEHGLREAQVLKTKNSYLSVIGVIAPMIGLLGTVIGMMARSPSSVLPVCRTRASSPPVSVKCSWLPPAVSSSPSRLHFLLLLPQPRDHRARQRGRQAQPAHRGYPV